LKNKSIKHGDVWWGSLDPTQGSEIKKTRPCIVLSHDTVNELRKTVVVVPFSSAAKPHPPIAVAVACQGKPVVAIIDQVRAVTKHRLKNKIECASVQDVRNITEALFGILQ